MAPQAPPVEVEDHHFFFTGPDVEQAIPYGIYDLTRNTGWVNVGVDHDTSAFAVASIRRPGSRDRAGDHGLPLPAGTSKWNKIEHRLFSHITMN